MARPTSIAKMGQYPLEPQWVTQLANLFEGPQTSARIADPFCHKGETIAELAKAWGNCDVYAAELEPTLAKEAIAKFGETRCYIADSFAMDVTNGSFPLIFLNPPFQDEIVNTSLEGKRRTEWRALNTWIPRLQDGGLIIWTAYAHHMSRAIFETFMRYCNVMEVFRFPGLHLETYTQIVIVGQLQKGRTPPNDAWIDKSFLVFEKLRDNPEKIRDITSLRRIHERNPDARFKIPNTTQLSTRNKFTFLPTKIDPATAASLNAKYGAHLLPTFERAIMPSPPTKDLPPLAMPNNGQIAVLISSGMLNDTMLIDPGSGMRIMIRGVVRREQLIVKREESVDSRGDEMLKEIQHTRPSQTIVVLREDGEISELYGADLVEYIRIHGRTLIHEFNRRYSPSYDKTIEPFWAQTYDTHFINGEHPLMTTQEYVASASTEHLLAHRSEILIGEPGVGKTALTMATIMNLWRFEQERGTPEWKILVESLLRRYPTMKSGKRLKGIKPGCVAILQCPPILPTEWQKQMEAFLPKAVIRRLTNVAETRQLFEAAKQNRDVLHIGIVTEEDMKRGSPIKAAYAIKRKFSYETVRTKDNQLVREARVNQLVIEPVTGQVLRASKRSGAPPMTPEGMNDQEVVTFEGEIPDGYVRSVERDEAGERLLAKHSFYAVNARPDSMIRNDVAGRDVRHFPLPMFQSVRTGSSIPKVGNGRVMTKRVEVQPIDSRIIQYYAVGDGDAFLDQVLRNSGLTQASMFMPTPKYQKHYKPFVSRNTSADNDFTLTCRYVVCYPKQRIVYGERTTENLRPHEPIVDAWIARKGLRARHTKIVSRIDKLMKQYKLDSYRLGEGHADIDKVLKKDGLLSYEINSGAEMGWKNPRYNLSEYITKRYRAQLGIFMCDELHRSSGMSTDVGIATRGMVYAASKVIGLTGTLYGGVASSVYSILFSNNQGVRSAFPWVRGTPMHFIESMGTVEDVFVTRATYNSRTGAFTGNKRFHETVGKEAPGCSPRLHRILLPNSPFVNLADLSRKMPDMIEIPIEIKMSDEMAAMYKMAHEKSTNYLRSCIASGDGSYTAAHYQGLLRLPDSMHRDNEFIHRMKIKNPSGYGFTVKEKLVMTVPGLGEDLRPKEIKLREFLAERISAGRSVIVYVSQTASRDIQPRIVQAIADLPGCKPFILKGSVSAQDRVQYITKKTVEEGCNVMISNPGLVTEGVNLIMFSAIVFMETDPSLRKMHQAASRIWRPSQPHPFVEIAYLYYDDDFQRRATLNVAAKKSAASVLYGTAAGEFGNIGIGKDDTYEGMTSAIEEDLRAISQEEMRKKFKEVSFTEETWTGSPWYGPGRNKQGIDNWVAVKEESDLEQDADTETEEEVEA